MTPSALRQALAAHRPSWPHDPHELLAAVESTADARPGDPVLTALLLAANLQATVPTGLPEHLVRDGLVRFDGLSATWAAHDADGERFLVRVPRPALGPVERRLLERDVRAVQALVPGVHVREGCAVAPLPGQSVAGPLPEPESIRLVVTTLVALEAWRAHGFGPMVPAPEELRHEGGVARIVALTPGPFQLEPWLRHLAFTLRPTGVLAPVLRGLVELPPAGPTDAGDRVRRALFEDLSARAIRLRQEQLMAGHARRSARLAHAIGRLQRALPPPAGESPVGFDLDARPTFVRSDGHEVVWGAAAEPQRLFDGEGFDAPAARRLLRALATSPTAAQGYPEQIGRWVSSGLRLRTLGLLLEKGA
ncbi:MAG: hypothetical protein KC656_03955 [Myxococcales bacterium]|nr:hypothetical protein [Myxococcales bacterium]MCB9668864.1 hypothetical protein [Alphaproteobacteria bacterium]MCB9691190.1 hypothetical protein [Alphaproteobacteria bacterium]